MLNLEDMYRTLRLAHLQAQNIVDTVREPLLVLDGTLCVQAASRSFFETFQVSRDETVGRQLYELGDGQWNIPELRVLLGEVIPRSMAVDGYEVDNDFPRIGHRSLLLNARKLHSPDNNATLLLLAMEDITDRKALAQQAGMHLREVQHRMKNVLAMVLGVARQTRATGRTAEEYRDVVLARLGALVEAYDIGKESAAETDLVVLVERLAEPYVPSPARGGIIVEGGPPVSLPWAKGRAITLVLHELATNAVKYGALSTGRGCARLGWRLKVVKERRFLNFHWREEGGPRIEAPAAPGFGTRLVKFITAGELGGRAELSFAPGGLEARLMVCLD